MAVMTKNWDYEDDVRGEQEIGEEDDLGRLKRLFLVS
jgi:hypothetical protein